MRATYFAILMVGFLLLIDDAISPQPILSSADVDKYWLTALAAHASDMSSWLFMGYPAVIFEGGYSTSWTAIGLLVFMFLNWQLIAPKIRVATEQYNSLTFSSFFESRLVDTSGYIRVFTAIMSLIFYTIYISAGLLAWGFCLKLFSVSLLTGEFSSGFSLSSPMSLLEGIRHWPGSILFQGIFLMVVIIFVPLFISAKCRRMGWNF